MIEIIGIGNPDRGDDAAGIEAVERLRRVSPPGVPVTELAGDQVRLLDVWDLDATVILIDATCSGAPPGTVTWFDASRPLAQEFTHRGSHTFSLADVIELARALGRLPRHVCGYGIEGATFAIGEPLSPAAERGVREVTDLVLEQL